MGNTHEKNKININEKKYKTKIDDKRGLRFGGISFYVNRCGRMEIFIGKKEKTEKRIGGIFIAFVCGIR